MAFAACVYPIDNSPNGPSDGERWDVIDSWFKSIPISQRSCLNFLEGIELTDCECHATGNQVLPPSICVLHFDHRRYSKEYSKPESKFPGTLRQASSHDQPCSTNVKEGGGDLEERIWKRGPGIGYWDVYSRYMPHEMKAPNIDPII